MEDLVLKRKVQKALEQVNKILELTRKPFFAGDVQHSYEDKFLLVEFMTRAAIVSQIKTLEGYGFSPEAMSSIMSWARNGESVSIRYHSLETCSFNRKTSREDESTTKSVTEIKGWGGTKKIESKFVTTVDEWFWNRSVTTTLEAFRGAETETVQLFTRTGMKEIMTTTESPPYPESRIGLKSDLDLTWLLNHVTQPEVESEDSAMRPDFTIDREAFTTATPRRNLEVHGALSYFSRVKVWAQDVGNYLEGIYKQLPARFPDSMQSMLREAGEVFVPVLPLLFEHTQSQEVVTSSGGSTVLQVEDLAKLLNEEQRTIKQVERHLVTKFPAQQEGIISLEDAQLFAHVWHAGIVVGSYAEAVTEVETMLFQQLRAAIGKELTSSDFTEYMRFHTKKLFSDLFAPRPFCQSVRRSAKHSPEGCISIEEGDESGGSRAVLTLSRKAKAVPPMRFALNAATDVTFFGDRSLHCTLLHRFSSEATKPLTLMATARQFSSMIVLVGTIESSDVFDAKAALIVKDKDELSIPLDVAVLPTPGEFKEAVESLSPEQKAFATAYRSMQLASTVFAVLTIQIKPQLEKVLNLPAGSLTKEIRLAQDLTKLFLEYQISSDLMCFDGDPDTVPAADQIDTVKGHVSAVLAMVTESKQEELAQRKQEFAFEQPSRMMARCEASEDEEECDMGGGGGMFGDDDEGYSYAPRCAGLVAEVRDLTAVDAQPEMITELNDTKEEQTLGVRGADSSVTEQQGGKGGDGEGSFDFTSIPKVLDARVEALDQDNALRPTTLKVSAEDPWTMKSYPSLLAKKANVVKLMGEQKSAARARAMDLLDSLTRSGALAIDAADLHVVIAATHTFDTTLMETVIKKNQNPVQKVEASLLVMGSTIHEGVPPQLMVATNHRSRIEAQWTAMTNASQNQSQSKSRRMLAASVMEDPQIVGRVYKKQSWDDY